MTGFELPRRSRRSGFALFAVLLVIALIGVGLSVAAESFVVAEQRERERELLLIGREFEQAIKRFAETGAGGERRHPRDLQELVEDRRGSGPPRRHLRRIYADPMTGKEEWGVVRVGGAIVAVHSLSRRKPLKVGGFEPAEMHLENRESYAEWLFGDRPAANVKSLPPAEAKK